MDFENLQIEHVLPQTLENDPSDQSWKGMLGVAWEQEHARWVHTLGNLTLTGYNQVMGNSSFAEKQQVFAHSNVSLNAHFVGLARWSPDEIKQRAIALGDGFARIWPRPDGAPYVPRLPDIDELFEETIDSPPPAPDPPHTHGRLRIVVHWSMLGRGQSDESIQEPTGAATHAKFIGRLIANLDPQISDRLQQIPVARTSAANPESGYRLSTNPTHDFINPITGRLFSHKPVPSTAYFLFTNTDHNTKVEDIIRLAQRLGFPPGSVEAF